MKSDTLKEKLKQDQEQYSGSSPVRLHRAISWLKRAEQEQTDLDAQFIFLWIAFNAAYAGEFDQDTTERHQLRQFFEKLLSVDKNRRLHSMAFHRFSGSIRLMVDNRFVFEPFWRALRDHDSSGRWEAQFSESKQAALKSIVSGDTHTVMGIIFDRLYVLRNQLVHGGATWNSAVNRAQVKDGAQILMETVPILIDLMLDHPELDCGAVLYPIV